MSTVRAAVLAAARTVELELREAPPVAPGLVRVAVESVGLCGSDMHYWAHGRNGANVLSQPTVLGHEGWGVVTEVGDGVPSDRVGTRVAVEPAHPCLRCSTCLEGRYEVCPRSTCLGSPPTDGMLQGSVLVPAPFAHPLPEELPGEAAALVEPLAVAVWAAQRAGELRGRDVLVTGAGPIGLLVLQVARAAGAASVTVTDVAAPRLARARELGADEALDARADLPRAAFHAVFECSGAPAAYASLVAVRPAGVFVVVGVASGDVLLPLGAAQRWEVDVRPSFRYGPGAFATAIRWASSSRVQLAPLVTSRFPLERADRAIACAVEDRSQVKVLVDVR